MKLTHEGYFRKIKLSVEQYGEILVTLAFRGEKMPDHQKGYDVKAKIDNKPARIEVKSKFAETRTGRATVVHCNDNKVHRDGMTHLVIILVDGDQDQPSVREAWLLTTAQATALRTKTKSKYINLNTLRKMADAGPGKFKRIEKKLQKAAHAFA